MPKFYMIFARKIFSSFFCVGAGGGGGGGQMPLPLPSISNTLWICMPSPLGLYFLWDWDSCLPPRTKFWWRHWIGLAEGWREWRYNAVYMCLNPLFRICFTFTYVQSKEMLQLIWNVMCRVDCLQHDTAAMVTTDTEYCAPIAHVLFPHADFTTNWSCSFVYYNVQRFTGRCYLCRCCIVCIQLIVVKPSQL